MTLPDKPLTLNRDLNNTGDEKITERNFIINPEHPEFYKLSDFKVQFFEIDPRLEIKFT